ncbi:MAG: acyl-CoA dehydrogenase family protein, partial [Corynebacterium sp.]|nr:acyl-CoA dehydrogenase family protein [Corynebacterium sp.]
MALTPGFDLFQLPEEHQELRAVIRDLAEKQIAPYAADVDENERFPEEALKALNEAGFNAVHVPEQFGGQGADSVAACIVIEEVARVCGSASLIPAVNKLGIKGSPTAELYFENCRISADRIIGEEGTGFRT